MKKLSDKHSTSRDPSNLKSTPSWRQIISKPALTKDISLIPMQSSIDILPITVKTFGGTRLCMKKRAAQISNFCHARPSCHATLRIYETSKLSFKISNEYSEYNPKLMQWSRGFWNSLRSKTEGKIPKCVSSDPLLEATLRTLGVNGSALNI